MRWQTVRNVRDLVAVDMSTVSKHRSKMKTAGLVEDRKDGLRVFYRLRVPCIMDFMNCVEAVLESNGGQRRIKKACCAPS